MLGKLQTARATNTDEGQFNQLTKVRLLIIVGLNEKEVREYIKNQEKLKKREAWPTGIRSQLINVIIRMEEPKFLGHEM